MSAGLLLLVAALAQAQEQAQPQPAALRQVSVAQYVDALAALERQIRAGQGEEARAAARALAKLEVAWGDEVLAADASLLSEIAQAPSEGALRGHAARLARLVAALQAAGGELAVPATAEPRWLDDLAAPPDAARGGTVPELRLKPLTLPERVEAALVAAWDRVADWLRAVDRWLRRLLPGQPPAPGDSGSVARGAMVFVGLAILVLLVVAVRALSRRAAAEPQPEAVAVATSTQDEDPLSRETSEWERHARELAAARRFREAIRAWYHAVLTSLFRRGELHYRKGRTNWEYVAGLDPGHRWRPGFIALTRLFDREWYGRRTSDGEALAECAQQAQEILSALHGSAKGGTA